MKHMTGAELEQFIEDMIADGHFIPRGDGLFDVSDEMHAFLQKFLQKHPELYPRIFPERVQ